jgi:DNA processing protein
MDTQQIDTLFPIRQITENDYPETLRNAKGKPKSLYIRGSLPPVHYKYLCVVGSRHPSPYGEEAVAKLIAGLAGYPICIVSGLAIGIDGMAHRAALEAGLHCVAFPGSSLAWQEILPREHSGLAETIVKSGGALLSEWRPGYPTGKWAFAARNRHMAGISVATLIIQAGRGSGSLMTAKHAEIFDRDVMAVPGSISNSLSYGTHMLIRRGAALISSSKDLLEELGFRVPRGSAAALGAQGMFNGFKRIAKTLPSHIATDELSVSILGALSLEEATTSFLLEKTGASVPSMNERLSLLELEGLVQIDSGLVKLV